MAKWDLSKLPEGRKPLPDAWFKERADMQELIEELEANLAVAIEFILRLNRFAIQADDKFLIGKTQEVLAELTEVSDE